MREYAYENIITFFSLLFVSCQLQPMKLQKELCVENVYKALRNNNPKELALSLNAYQKAHKNMLKREPISLESLNNVIIMQLIQLSKKGACYPDQICTDPQLVLFLEQAEKNIAQENYPSRPIRSYALTAYGAACLLFGVSKLAYDIYCLFDGRSQNHYIALCSDMLLIGGCILPLYDGFAHTEETFNQAKTHQLYTTIANWIQRKGSNSLN